MIDHAGEFQPNRQPEPQQDKTLARERNGEQELSPDTKHLINDFLGYLKHVGKEPPSV